MLLRCPVCDAEFVNIQFEKYNICSCCGASVLLSKIDCIVANKNYFNRIAGLFDEKNLNANREQKFYKIENFYKKINHKTEIENYYRLINKSNKLFLGKKSLEIGFGFGDELYRKLESGCDAYGIDLSEENVKKFKNKYKKYKDKVFLGNAEGFSAGKYDLVYSNALFEHLDSPKKFLKDAFSCLQSGGFMIIKCPIIYQNQNKLDKYSGFDINFWNPCHRILHTMNSMRMIVEEMGGGIQDYGLNPYMGYNLLSVMIKNGIRKMHDIRNPFYMIPELKSEWKFNFFLLKSFFYRPICADSIFIIRKK